MLNHTVLALLAFDTFEAFYSPQQRLSKQDCDVCRAALIFHDAWKYEHLSGKINPKFTTKEHGFIAAKKLVDYYKKYEAINGKNEILKSSVDMIVDCVRYHMSNWCHSFEETKFAQTKTKINERIVMICDFLASNKQLHEYTKII